MPAARPPVRRILGRSLSDHCPPPGCPPVSRTTSSRPCHPGQRGPQLTPLWGNSHQDVPVCTNMAQSPGGVGEGQRPPCGPGHSLVSAIRVPSCLPSASQLPPSPFQFIPMPCSASQSFSVSLPCFPVPSQCLPVPSKSLLVPSRFHPSAHQGSP